MPRKDFANCLGIDLRTQQYANEAFALKQGNNCTLLQSGSIGNRPPLVNPIVLDANSVGLYKIGGTLRTVVPGGQGIVSPDPSYVIYDQIGDSRYANNVYPLGKLAALNGAASFGASTLGPYSYVSVLRADTNQTEHHWIQTPQVSGVPSTRIGLPFQPGKAFLKLSNKLWCDDPANGYVRFCASENLSASDWTTVGDAGFLAVANYAAQSDQIQGLSSFHNQMVVLFADAMLIYTVSAIPANIALVQQLYGPGSVWPLSACNFLGDTIFLSNGGFRTIRPMLVLNDIARPDDIGARILPLTSQIPMAQKAIGIYVEAMGAYLCAVGTAVYVWYNYPLEQRQGWMVWQLPVSVEYMVELNGVIYIRSGNTVYQVDPTQDTDFNGQKIIGNWESVEIMLGEPNHLSRIDWLTMKQTARATVALTCDGVPTMKKSIPGLAPRPVRTPAWGASRQTTIGAAFQGAYQFQGGSIEFEPLPV